MKYRINKEKRAEPFKTIQLLKAYATVRLLQSYNAL